MTTSIGAAGLALNALLATAAATGASPLYQVQTVFGEPDQYQDQEIVCVTGVSALDELSRVLGPQPNKRDEAYSLDVTVRCEQPEGSSTDVWTRGWAMYDAVRAIVLTNQTLTSTVFSAFPIPAGMVLARRISKEGKDMPGWVIRVDMAVVCKFRTA